MRLCVCKLTRSRVEALALATHPDVVCRSLCCMLLTLAPPALQVAINAIKLMVPMLGR